MRPTVLLVVDGLRRDRAQRFLNTPFQLVAAGQGSYVPMMSLMPTKSRPSYNTISTGMPSPQNGTASNDDTRLVSIPSIWTIARDNNLTTAASAYHWWSELFNRSPFVRERDTLVEDDDGAIRHGFFYERDGEPDAVVFAHALRLWQRHRPDVLLIHPCSVDHAGDYWGAGNLAYDECVKAIDLLLGPLFQALWQERPDAIILATSDHGMAASGGHGWDAPELREVFFFALGRHLSAATATEATALDVAPTVLYLMGLAVPGHMTGRPLVSSDL